MLYVGAVVTPLVPSWVGNAESLLSSVCGGLPPQGGEGAISEHAHHVGWFVSAFSVNTLAGRCYNIVAPAASTLLGSFRPMMKLLVLLAP